MNEKIKNYLQLALVFVVCWGIAGIFDGSGFINGVENQIDAIGSIISYIIKISLFLGGIWLIIEIFKNPEDNKENDTALNNNSSVLFKSNDYDEDEDYDYDEDEDYDYDEDEEEDEEERAQILIKTAPILKDIGKPYNGIEIFNIQLTDNHGEPYIDYDNNPYAIVTFKAFSEVGFEQANDAFFDEEYQIPKRKLLAMRMSINSAENLKVGMNGSLILHNVVDAENHVYLVPLKFIPNN